MNKRSKVELTEGSKYRILSVGGKDNVLETEGVFRGFISIGVDEIGLLIELSKNHKEMAGKIRIVPLHVILAIDVFEVKENQTKEQGKETHHYVG
jgi:hypothetical protein